MEGIERLSRDQILPLLSSVAGQPFSEFNVAVDRDTILAQYFEKGFPRATFEWNSTAAAEPNRVDLHYVVHEGQQQFVRQVLISGNRVTRSRLINRNITLNPGDPLSPTAMTDIQRRLYGLGVFARVDAAIQNPDGDSDRKYVLYNLEEARRYSLAVGFGAELGRIGQGCQTCFDSPAGATGFSPRVSLDIARNNLWGMTHSISLRTRVSTLDQRVLLNYSWPHFHNNDNLTVSFTGLYEDSHDINTFSFRRAGGLAAAHPAAQQGHHAVLPVHLPARRRERPQSHAVPDPAGFATGAGRHDVSQPGAGPPRRSPRPAPGHLQHRRPRTGRSHFRFAAQLCAAAGAECDLLSASASAWCWPA